MMLNRISLNTIGLNRIGLNRIGKPSRGSSERPYIDPEVLASLKAVCICYGKSNDDPDRAIIKNLVDPDNPFVISNAAFKLNSGFGKYGMDFLEWKANSGMNFTSTKLTSTKPNLPGGWLTFRNVSGLISETKVKVSGAPKEFGFIGNNNGTDDKFSVTINNGVYTIPEFTLSSASGFYINNNSGDWSNLVIEQIPSFEGAFVTDGIEDLITSTKTVQEMLGGSNEITVVSMIHQIGLGCRTNFICDKGSYWRCNEVANTGEGKTGIYGYSSTNISVNTPDIINNVLGDKVDYSVTGDRNDLTPSQFSVVGYISSSGEISYTSSVAWYWNFISNKVLTTDQINQVIAYFNLDRTLKPDILCNTIKQGITNENHAEFGDKLIDFSGNGRDIQLNNIAWKGDSGIGKYNFSNINIIASNRFEGTVTTNKCHFTKKLTDTTNNFCDLLVISPNEPIKFKVSGLSDGRKLFVANKSGSGSNYNFDNGEHEVSLSFSEGVGQNNPFGVTGDIGDIDVTVEFIPSHEGALCLDGVNDFGKVTGMPIYKDYTFIAEREFLSTPDDFVNAGSIVSKMHEIGKGSFIFETFTKTQAREVSFSSTTDFDNPNTDRSISYQSKYSYNGKALTAGQVEDRDVMWLGTIRDNDSRFINAAIYSLMSFPYSMSEFLIERQLKKHKLGTLYPNMVEFRPVIKANANYNIFYTALLPLTGDIWERINIGDYVPVGRRIAIQMSFDNEASELVSAISSQLGNISITKNSNNKGYTIFGDILKNKSPQKINITIDEYIRYEDIVQPYPVLLRFNDENGNEVSWGGKFRVGSTITRIGSFYENNLIDGLYIVRNPKLNGNNLITPTHVVEKSMVFTCDTEYLLDNNEPKCILSPSRLRIPNSSYKILGYIPDISGHGNHGVIHNSAYAGASGANGYLQNFSGWTKASGVSSTDSVISSSNNLVAANGWIAYVTSGTVIPTFKVEISGIPINGNLRFEGSDQTLVNGVNTIQGLTTTKVSGFYISNGYDNDWSNLRIEQIGEYEGAYCLDGVDDFVTIPTTVGGKQVLMKVNWQKSPTLLYDQRASGSFAVLTTLEDDAVNPRIAYQARNQDGKTYIDGIENNYIETYTLKDITHNITIANSSSGGIIVPVIGCNTGKTSNFAQMSLYDFMLFDEISTEDKIKELNEYIGIEAKVELPPYYWDAYGKTNLDEDKNYTANLGTVKDVIEVSQPAIFAENWYDGNPEPVLSSPIINQTDYSIEVKANKMDNNFTMMLDVECDTPLPAFKAKFSMVGTAISVDLKYYINGGSKIIDVFKSGGSTEPVILDIPASERSFIYGTNTDNYPNILIEILPADNGTRYGLTNTNFAYDKMSGYGGYNLSRFDKSWSSSSNTSIKVVQRNPYDITLKKLGGNSDWEFNNTELKVISNPVYVKFKSNKNIRVTCDYHYYPVGGNSEGTPLGITSKDLIANKDAIITISPISQENIDKYNIDVNRGYYLIYFQLSSTLAVNEEVTIEMLPLYPNGLVYDGVTDYSENANIPALTDYTYIFKRELLNLDKVGGGASLYKGSFYSNGGRAFIVDINDKNPNSEMSGYSYGNRASTSTLKTNKIIYGTKTSVNGVSVTPGSNTDNASLTLGKWDVNYKQMVFYKLILYPKTIPLLQINFLKNLMERDEIIDLNNPIFVQE